MIDITLGQRMERDIPENGIKNKHSSYFKVWESQTKANKKRQGKLF